MKILQEENIQAIEPEFIKRFQLDSIACLFFILGMFMSAYLLHHFIL